MAAVSLGAPIRSIAIVTITCIMMAISTVVAHEVGAGDFATIPHTVR
ncbi:MATE family efflux transporter [Pseudoduganella sp. RAF53_2]